MKKLKSLIIILCAVMLLAPSVKAQDTGFSPTMIVKTNPIAALGGPFWVLIVPLTGEYKALFEIKTTPKQSFTIGASYLGSSLLLSMDDITADGADIIDIKTSGFRVQGWYKFYIGRNSAAPEGFYLGPHVSYASAAISEKDVPDNKLGMAKLNINGVIGYQIISDGGFALDIFTGLGVKNLGFTADGTTGDDFDFSMDSKFAPAVVFGMNFGFAF